MQYFNDGYFALESTDEKPTEGIKLYQLLVELDTGKLWYWSGTEWKEFGGDA